MRVEVATVRRHLLRRRARAQARRGGRRERRRRPHARPAHPQPAGGRRAARAGRRGRRDPRRGRRAARSSSAATVSSRRSSRTRADEGLDVIDATCPHVSKAHEAAEELKRGGYIVVIVGEADHPEVEGIMAHAGGQGARRLLGDRTARPACRRGAVGIVVQTTQSLERLTEVVEAILPRASELRVFNTICSATGKRQQSAEELAETVDVMVVVGGHNSGNTTRLARDLRGGQPARASRRDRRRSRPGLVRGRRERRRDRRRLDARRADAGRHPRHRSDGVSAVTAARRLRRARIPPSQAGESSRRVDAGGPAARAGLARRRRRSSSATDSRCATSSTGSGSRMVPSVDAGRRACGRPHARRARST